jgi:hypothetical protein
MSETSYPQPPADRSVKVPHLVFGLLFLGVAAIWALGASDAIDGEHLAVLAPVVLIGAGVIGLAASLASGRNRRGGAVRHDYQADYQADHQPEAYDAPEYTEHHVTDSTTDTTTDTEPTAPLVADQRDEPTEENR